VENELVGMSVPQEEKKQKSLLRLVFSGFAMGAADVVPGVSGGTIAFLMGIYDDLLQAIHAVDGRFFRLLLGGRFRQAFGTANWRFLAALGTGLALALLTISRLLVWGLEHHPAIVAAFFFGLVLASVLVVAKRLSRWTPLTMLITAASAVGAYLLFGLVPVETPSDYWFLFMSGAIAISAMILPGISGAFILLVLGKYHYILESLVTGNWLPLVFVGAGAAVGLLSFVRVLRWLLHHHHDLTVAALIGLVIGALRKVWPWKEIPPAAGLEEVHFLEANVLPQAFTGEVALALVVIALGFGLVFVLEAVGKRQS
jgi:putative membrane protein